MIRDGFDFSLSGLKTAVLHAVRGSDDLARDRADLAASFQRAVFDVLGAKVERALDLTGYATVVVGGGVACNRTLADDFAERLTGRARVAIASPRLNSDNAAMIARAGWFHLEHNRTSDFDLEANARMAWPGLETAPLPSATHSSG
jgi:N6-L-threonylcarbamoyladenine synthase